MTDGQLRRLVRRFQGGDERAWDKLAAECEPLCRQAAWYVRRGASFTTEPIEHLINEARVGLLRAARSYDHRPGVKFLTFAIFHARNAVRKYLRFHGRTIRLPAYQFERRQGDVEGLEKLTPLSLAECEFEVRERRDDIAQCEARILAEQLLTAAHPRDREILRLRLLDDVPSVEIGAQFGLNHIYVMRVVRKTLSEMRARL